LQTRTSRPAARRLLDPRLAAGGLPRSLEDSHPEAGGDEELRDPGCEVAGLGEGDVDQNPPPFLLDFLAAHLDQFFLLWQGPGTLGAEAITCWVWGSTTVSSRNAAWSG